MDTTPFLSRVVMETEGVTRTFVAFRWLWRQRIRLHLEGTGINPRPVDLHEQQLSLEQHSQAHRITTLGLQQRRSAASCSGPAGQQEAARDCSNRCCLLSDSGTPAENSSEPRLLPVRGLNEIFIGESLSSRYLVHLLSTQTLGLVPEALQTCSSLVCRASYYEISVDDGPWEKQKSSGLSICTGTGSKAW